ncbi:hypothetical protein F2P81_013306 [Scophthalmus maximus]|uniref:Uncharacterized protein n=1 Tax=Scophthalmus maximus TaxID=52904 RepID=A0A6A4STW1_SCOMX|nr:hypothetical protein F2P81_013306 [Scophthalmus maximus]
MKQTGMEDRAEVYKQSDGGKLGRRTTAASSHRSVTQYEKLRKPTLHRSTWPERSDRPTPGNESRRHPGTGALPTASGSLPSTESRPERRSRLRSRTVDRSADQRPPPPSVASACVAVPELHACSPVTSTIHKDLDLRCSSQQRRAS